MSGPGYPLGANAYLHRTTLSPSPSPRLLWLLDTQKDVVASWRPGLNWAGGGRPGVAEPPFWGRRKVVWAVEECGGDACWTWIGMELVCFDALGPDLRPTRVDFNLKLQFVEIDPQQVILPALDLVAS